MHINYTATREVIASHTAGNSYDLETDAQQDPRIQQNIARKHVALSGVTEGVHHRVEKIWNLRTGLITNSELDQWWEFFASVGSGEQFTFDRRGTLASPDAPVTAYLESGPGYNPLGPNAHEFSFTVRAA